MNCILKFILGKLLGIYLHKEFRINLFAISFDHIHVAISNLCLASWALSYISPHLIDMLHIESLYLDFECVFCIPYAVSIKLCGVSILLSQEEDQNTHENVNPCTLKASPYSSSSSSISPSCNSSSAAELVAAWIEALCSNVQIELMNATVQHSPSHLTLSLANFSSTVACTSANLNSVISLLGSQIHSKDKVLFVQHSQTPLVCSIASGGQNNDCILRVHCDDILQFTIEEELLSSLHLLALPSSPSSAFKAVDNLTSSLLESDLELLQKYRYASEIFDILYNLNDSRLDCRGYDSELILEAQSKTKDSKTAEPLRNFSASMSFQHLDVHIKSTSRCESLLIHLKDIGTTANNLSRFTVIVQHLLTKQEQNGVENLNFEFIHADASIITSELGNEMAVTIGNVKMLASSTGVFQLSKLLEHSLLPKRVHSLSLYNISISCHGVDATFRQLDYLSSPLKWRLICTELLVVNKEKSFNLQSQSSALSLYKVTSPSMERWAPFLASKSTRCAIENSELNRWASLSIDSLEADGDTLLERDFFTKLLRLANEIGCFSGKQDHFEGSFDIKLVIVSTLLKSDGHHIGLMLDLLDAVITFTPFESLNITTKLRSVSLKSPDSQQSILQRSLQSHHGERSLFKCTYGSKLNQIEISFTHLRFTLPSPETLRQLRMLSKAIYSIPMINASAHPPFRFAVSVIKCYVSFDLGSDYALRLNVASAACEGLIHNDLEFTGNVTNIDLWLDFKRRSFKFATMRSTTVDTVKRSTTVCCSAVAIEAIENFETLCQTISKCHDMLIPLFEKTTSRNEVGDQSPRAELFSAAQGRQQESTLRSAEDLGFFYFLSADVYDPMQAATHSEGGTTSYLAVTEEGYQERDWRDLYSHYFSLCIDALVDQNKGVFLDALEVNEDYVKPGTSLMASSGSGVSELPQDVFNFSICLLTILLQKSEGRIEFEAADLKAICTDFSISEQNLPRNISFSVQNIQLGFATDGSLPKLVLKRWCPVQILPLSSDPFVRLQLEGAVIDEKNCYSLDVSILPIICHIDGRFIRFTHQALSHIPSLTGSTADISPSLVRSALVHAIRLKIYLEIESMDVQKLRCGDLKQLFSMFPLDGCELSLSEVLVHHSMMSNSQWISEIIRRWMGEVKATGPGRILGSIYQFKGLSEIVKKTNDLMETITTKDSSRLSYTIALSERSLALGHTIIVEMISMSQKSLLVTSRLLYAMASQRQGRLLRPGTVSNSDIEDCVQQSRGIIMREIRLAFSSLNDLTSECRAELDQDVSLLFQRLLEMVLRPVAGTAEALSVALLGLKAKIKRTDSADEFDGRFNTLVQDSYVKEHDSAESREAICEHYLRRI